MGKPIGPVVRRRYRTPNEVFGRALTELRTEKGISQANFAASLGYSTYYVGKIERGTANVTCDLMAAVAKFFGVSIGQFWIYAESLAKKKG